MSIKSEDYTNEKKAYLTYAPEPAAKARLLYEDHKKMFDIFLDGDKVYSSHSFNRKTLECMENCGFEIKTSTRTTYTGRNSFVLESGLKIPVVVRKIIVKGVLVSIRVRITAKTTEKLMETTYAIRDTLSAYGLKHKLCVWDRTGLI